MGKKGKLIYKNYVDMSHMRHDNKIGIIMIAIIVPLLIILLSANAIRNYKMIVEPSAFPIEDLIDFYLPLLAFSIMIMFSPFILRDFILHHFYPGPDLYENGIYMEPNAEESWIFLKRKFLPFSEIEAFIINPDEEFVLITAKNRIEDYKKLDEESGEEDSWEGTEEERLAYHIDIVKEEVFILTREGKKYDYMKSGFDNLNRVINFLTEKGIKIV